MGVTMDSSARKLTHPISDPAAQFWSMINGGIDGLIKRYCTRSYDMASLYQLGGILNAVEVFVHQVPSGDWRAKWDAFHHTAYSNIDNQKFQKGVLPGPADIKALQDTFAAWKAIPYPTTEIDYKAATKTVLTKAKREPNHLYGLMMFLVLMDESKIFNNPNLSKAISTFESGVLSEYETFVAPMVALIK